VLSLALADKLAFMFSALQAVNIPSDKIAELSRLHKFLLLNLDADVKPLNFVLSLCKLGSGLVSFLFSFKIFSLQIIDFLLKLCDILLLAELFLVFGLSKLNVALS